VLALAGQLGVWVAMGSAHRLGAGHKPHNSLYLITPDGELAGPQ
jgi:predicted amidohydrolase